MMRMCLCIAALAAAAALAGCNENAGVMAEPIAAAPISPVDASLPHDAPCSGEISRFRTIVKADLNTGNLEQKVYDKIERDLSRAALACSAGKGGEAHAIVANSKARNGYRA